MARRMPRSQKSAAQVLVLREAASFADLTINYKCPSLPLAASSGLCGIGNACKSCMIKSSEKRSPMRPLGIDMHSQAFSGYRHLIVTIRKVIETGLIEGTTDGELPHLRDRWWMRICKCFVTPRGSGAEGTVRRTTQTANSHRSRMPRTPRRQHSPEDRWPIRKHAATRHS